MPVNKTKTPEEIEKESDMNPEFEFDPILDILKEADEKLNLIKVSSNKKDKGKKKKTKSSKGGKGKKGKVVKEATDQEDKLDVKKKLDKTKSEENEPNDEGLDDVSTKEDNDKIGNSEKRNKNVKRKKGKGKKKKKAKGKVSQRINFALNIQENDPDDKNLQVK